MKILRYTLKAIEYHIHFSLTVFWENRRCRCGLFYKNNEWPGMDLYSEMFYGKPYSKLPYFTKYRYIVDAFAFAELLWSVAIIYGVFSFSCFFEEDFRKLGPFSVLAWFYWLSYPFLVAAFNKFLHKHSEFYDDLVEETEFFP